MTANSAYEMPYFIHHFIISYSSVKKILTHYCLHMQWISPMGYIFHIYHWDDATMDYNAMLVK